jgi:hypothetical protein
MDPTVFRTVYHIMTILASHQQPSRPSTSPENHNSSQVQILLHKLSLLNIPLCSASITGTSLNPLMPNFSIPQKSHTKQCQNCKAYRNSSKFYYSCYHLCIFCGFHRVSYRMSCLFCHTSKVLSDVKHYGTGITCLGCKTKKVIAEDLVTEICEEHSHCYVCLHNAWATMKCQCCGKVLDAESQKIVKKTLFSKCRKCKNVIEAKFFVKKKCCRRKFCVFCQRSEDCKKCIGCKKELSVTVTAALNSLPEPDQ